LVGRLVGWLIGHREVTGTSLCLFSFITWAHPSRPFYALRATPKTVLKFGWLVGWLVDRSVSRSRGSHRNVMLPLQFRHPDLRFLTLLRPAGHPKTALNFGWSVGRSVRRSQGSHTNITLPIQFHHQGPLFQTLLRPAHHPQNDPKFWSIGWSVSRSVGRSGGSHTNDMLPL
jgi:hypothetical protein